MRPFPLLFVALAVVAVTAPCRADMMSPKDMLDFLDSMITKWKRPEYCGHSKCPPFKLDKKTDEYEIRTYDSGVWAVTNVTDSKYELAYTKAATRLMRYFRGANDDNVSMEQTVPTLAALKLDKGAESTEKDYAFSMWLHPDFQDDAPEPTDANIEIVDFHKVTVYVRSFGGFATEATILQEVQTLHEHLEKDDRRFDEDCVFVAVYDPAVKLFNRHNEIHVYKSEKKEASVASS